MIPYLGCKDKIVDELLAQIPAAEHFYDLFGGGGCVTEAALALQGTGLFGKWWKWDKVHYNELNTGVCELNKAVWSGTFDFKKAQSTWISRERFFEEKKLPTAWGAYVRFCWSFSNDGDSYIYGKKLELAKHLMHAIIMADSSLVRGDTPKERRLLMKKIVRMNGIAELQSLQSLERFEKLQKLERLQSLESLENMQNLERLQNLKRLQSLKNPESLQNIALTNMDYRDVPIKPNSVVYCDIPYNTPTSKGDYGVNFDHAAFYKWVKTRKFPVYFSDFSCAENFKCIWERQRINNRAKKDGKGIVCIERLFWNGVSLK